MKIHSITGQIETIYIAEYSSKLLLLDGGTACDSLIIENFITLNLKRPISDLKLMVVTHMHPDHAGAAPILKKKYNIPIAAYKTCNLWYSGFFGFLQHKLDILMAWIVVVKSGKQFKRMWYSRFINSDFYLSDGDNLPDFSDWKIFHMPGHTTHDIVLYNQKNKLIYTADIILKVNGRCMLPFPVTIPHYMEKTLQKLSKFKIKTILMAHGGECSIKAGENIFLKMIPLIYRPHTKYMRRLSPFTKLSGEIKEFEGRI